MSYVQPSQASIDARNKRIKESTESMEHVKLHYKKFIKKRALNIKNKIAPKHVKLDKRGFRL